MTLGPSLCVLWSGATGAAGTAGAGTWTDRVMASDQNHVQSMTDTAGSITTYAWNNDKDRVTSITDPKGNTRYFTYDPLPGRLIKVKQPATVGGVVTDVEKQYTYSNGRLSGITDLAGNVKVEYTYDSWGKILSVTGSEAATLGVKNPFRYRGYYYDGQTGMYYLGARYYVPTLMRFINPDNTAALDVQEELYDKNLYTYFDNNPVVRYDISGCFWKELFTAGITIAAAGIAVVAFAPAIACAVIAVVGGSAASATVLGASVAVVGYAAFISGAAMAGCVAILKCKNGWKKADRFGKRRRKVSFVSV